MSRITMELLRKRSEHNEGEIHNLEEIALHQQNIEKIELLNHACRDLKILLLQNNLISKIENLNKLKYLEYLNLAINNIERIENLEGLESLKKLDLSVNFIGDLRSVKNLRLNTSLRELMLVGNPCADYEGYRSYVIAVLPQLKEFDMIEINRTERIEALQKMAESKGDVVRGFQTYVKVRQKQIADQKLKKEMDGEDDEENEKFWERKCLNTPETRIAIAERRMKLDEERHKSTEEEKPKFKPKLFDADGRPYNVNRAKVPFKFVENENNIMLEVGVYKFLDTSYVDVDIQTFYVRVTIKGKVLQLTLPCEICTEKSFVKRNTVTGSLAITMPRLQPLTIIRGKNSGGYEIGKEGTKMNNFSNDPKVLECGGNRGTKRELLEIGPPLKNMDFSRIVEDSQQREKSRVEKVNKDADFVDNPEVPPLE